MDKEKLLKISEKAISLGWSIIPVGMDKVPLIPWKKYQNERASIEEIKTWLDTFPEMQLGVATGKISNLTVVDFEVGADFDLIKDKTFTVKTGSGGIHKYFQYEEGFKNAVRIFPLVDLRSEGGYCVTIGSKTTKGDYLILDDCPVAKMSPETKKLLVEGTKPVQGTVSSIKREETPDEIRSDSFFLIESYPGYGPGMRNDEMTRFIGKVLTRIHPVHWEKYGWDIITKANAKNTPPLSTGELYNSFKSIRAIETRKTPIHTPTGRTEAFTAPVVVATDGSEDIKHISKVAFEQVINQDDVYPLEIPCFDELLDGGFSPGDLITIAGKTGEGKTSLAQDWTLSFIRGPKKAPVLWFSYEVLASHLWKKFQKMGMTEDDLAVIPAKHSSGNVAWVEAKIKEAKEKFNVKVVVIDHLGFLLPKSMGMIGKNMSSNYATFLTQIVRDLKTVALNEELIIVLPVHLRKTEHADIDAIKDSVGISQESDAVFLIERERNKDSEAKSYYTEYSKITLAKNRKTGQTIASWFTMLNERFAYSDRNEIEQRVQESFNSFDKPLVKNIEPEEREAIVVNGTLM